MCILSRVYTVQWVLLTKEIFWRIGKFAKLNYSKILATHYCYLTATQGRVSPTIVSHDMMWYPLTALSNLHSGSIIKSRRGLVTCVLNVKS